MSSLIVVTSLRVNIVNNGILPFSEFPTFPQEIPYKSSTYEDYGKRENPPTCGREGVYHTPYYSTYIYSNLLIYIGLLKGIVREFIGN